MNVNWMKLTALGCCVLYILVFLFAPFVAVKLVGIGASGMDLFSITAWSYLPLIMGIVMGVCALIAPSKAGAGVCAGGAFVPLITYLIVRSQIVNGVLGLTGISRVLPIGNLSTAIFTIGLGGILPIILGIAAAVLCFLSENVTSRPTDRTPGFGAGMDDDF